MSNLWIQGCYYPSRSGTPSVPPHLRNLGSTLPPKICTVVHFFNISERFVCGRCQIQHLTNSVSDSLLSVKPHLNLLHDWGTQLPWVFSVQVPHLLKVQNDRSVNHKEEHKSATTSSVIYQRSTHHNPRSSSIQITTVKLVYQLNRVNNCIASLSFTGLLYELDNQLITGTVPTHVSLWWVSFTMRKQMKRKYGNIFIRNSRYNGFHL